MRLGPPYTVQEIKETPFEYDGRPFGETRRGKMWEARIAYWRRLSNLCFGLLAVLGVVEVVAVVAVFR